MRSAYRAMYTLALFGAIGLSRSVNAQTSATVSQSPNGAKPAEQVYKNIRVLKGTPSDQLIPAMRFVSASLGVECGFCHVEQHFDQDDKKPKQTARKMMQMVNAINQNSFDNHQEVTCNSCHRGSRLPISIPAIRDTPGVPQLAKAEEQLPPDLPSVDAVLSRYVEAIGGDAALKKITTRAESGTADFFGRQVEVQIFDKAPEKRLSIMRLPGGDSITGVDGNQGWIVYPHRPVLAMSSSELYGEKMDADLQVPLHLKELFPGLSPAAPEKINGRDAYQMTEVVGTQPRVKLYFDEQSGLLVRLVRYSETPLGLNPLQIDYTDYRAVDGVQVPYRWTTSRPEGQFTVQLTDVKQNVAIEDAKFVKPQAESAPK